MEDFPLEIKPSFGESQCLICARFECSDSSEPTNFSGGLIEGPEEKERIFYLLCNSLKIRLSYRKRISWDFKKESLPFCHSCLELSQELWEIKESIRVLELQFAEKVEAVRTLIIDSKTPEEVYSESHGFKGEKRKNYERFVIFRHQIKAKPGPKKAKQSQQKEKESASLPKSKNLKSSTPLLLPLVQLKNLKDLIEEEPTTSSRRSSRSAAQKIQSIYLKTEEDDADDPEDEEHSQEDDPSDMSYLYPAEYEENVDEYTGSGAFESYDMDIKPLIEAKEDSDMDYEVPEPLTISSASRKVKATKKANKRPPKKRRKGRGAKQSDDSETEYDDDGSDYDPEFKLDKNANSADEDYEEDDFDYDDDNDDGRKYKKWEKTGTGNLIYGGIEVISTENGLKCTKCDNFVVEGKKTENHRMRMRRHIKLQHLPKTEHTCNLCGKVTLSQYQLNLHIKMTHEKSLVYPCKVCERPFSTNKSLKNHLWSHKNEEEKQAALEAGQKMRQIWRSKKILPCQTCGKVFNSQYFLTQHEQTHLDMTERSKHICEICGEIYLSDYRLRLHMKTHDPHSNYKLHWLQCPHCPKKYENASKLTIHVRYHTGEKPFKCPECGEGIRTKNLLKVHLNMHKDFRPHGCDDCEMRFFKRYHLRRHREVYHNSEKPPPTRKMPYRSRNGIRKIYVRKNKRNAQTSGEDTTTATGQGESVNIPGNQPQAQYNPNEMIANNINQQFASVSHNLNEAALKYGLPFGGYF